MRVTFPRGSLFAQTPACKPRGSHPYHHTAPKIVSSTGLCGFAGGASGLIAWTVTAKKMYESPTVLSLQNNEPMLAGCCCSMGMGLIVCVILVSASLTIPGH